MPRILCADSQDSWRCDQAHLEGFFFLQISELAREGRLQSQIVCALTPSPSHPQTNDRSLPEHFNAIQARNSDTDQKARIRSSIWRYEDCHSLYYFIVRSRAQSEQDRNGAAVSLSCECQEDSLFKMKSSGFDEGLLSSAYIPGPLFDAAIVGKHNGAFD